MNKVGLYTLGCKVSLYETEAIAESFEAAGFGAVFLIVANHYTFGTERLAAGGAPGNGIRIRMIKAYHI